MNYKTEHNRKLKRNKLQTCSSEICYILFFLVLLSCSHNKNNDNENSYIIQYNDTIDSDSLIAKRNTLNILNFQQDITILDFAETQLDDFEIIKTSKKGYDFVWRIEKHQLHNNKIEITLKAKNSHSNQNSYNKTIYSRIQMWQFEFETTEKCKQTIDSLLNCFSDGCSIKRQVNQTAKTTPSIWILDKKRIIIAETSCEHVDEKWNNFKRDFAKTFADVDTEIIVTECGYLTWKKKEEVIL